MGFEAPTPIQAEAIPIIREGVDLLGCAQTGTGKTAAFVLPILDRIARKGDDARKTTVLIIAPTRELVLQIDQQIEGFGYFVPVSSKAIYGGNDGQQWGLQREAVDAGVDILVATPGRLIQFMQLGIADFSAIETLILDEADRMLDMGFFPDIMRIVKELPQKRQTLFFSATMPSDVRNLANTLLHAPKSINIAVARPPKEILQQKQLLNEGDKVRFLTQFFASRTDIASAIVFAERKVTVRELALQLTRNGLPVVSIHSDLEQEERERSLVRFKARQVRVLVATDIVARGIDIEDVDLVVNFNVPLNPESYVHRVGRTARASSSGESLTLYSPKEKHLLDEIEAFLGYPIAELPAMEGVVIAPVDLSEAANSQGRSKGRRPGGNGRRTGRGAPQGGGQRRASRGRSSGGRGRRRAGGRAGGGSAPTAESRG